MFRSFFSGYGNKQPHNPDYKLPDQIIVGESENVNHGEDEHDDKSGTGDHSNSLSLRWLSALGLLFCVVFGSLMLVLVVLSTALSLITFLTNASINEATKGFWKLFVNTFMATVGFALAILFPAVGLGLLVLYFSLGGANSNENLLTQVIRGLFRF